MSNMINMFLLAGNKFMLEMHLRQPGSAYRACGPFTINKTRIQKLDSRHIYGNKLDKACFQYVMA